MGKIKKMEIPKPACPVGRSEPMVELQNELDRKRMMIDKANAAYLNTPAGTMQRYEASKQIRYMEKDRDELVRRIAEMRREVV